MNFLLFQTQVRRLAAKCGMLRPLRYVVFRWRGGATTPENDLAWYSRFLNAGQLVFDVGANRGQSSEIFIQLGTRVVAFEPQDDLHAEIRQLCRNSPHLTIESCGLGHREETRRFFRTEYDQVASLREDWEGVRIGDCEIQISTLDKQIERHGLPDYCKIDVEGWELQVLEGLSQPIPIITFEYHLSPSEIEQALSVLDRIAALGEYHCNLKGSSKNDFALPEFLPVNEFRKRFPHHLDLPHNEGYGDIFCALKPSVIRSAQTHA